MSHELVTRLRERLGAGSAHADVANWLCNNTLLEGKPWSFKDHEFQIAICNDNSPDASIKKPSQVGLSELSLRIMLALCGIRNYFRVIYILPSATFASEFSKTRIDPVIEESARLRSMLVTAANSAMAKRIGTSTMWMAGAATKAQAISRPATALLFDELDFQNPEVSTLFMSRIRHAADPWVRRFSTPTVEGYGIDEAVSLTDRMRYFVRCKRCGHRQAPIFSKAVRIPLLSSKTPWNHDGFEDGSLGFMAFSKNMLLDADMDFSRAYLACEHCHKDLTASLLDPEEREWVATMQQVRLARGYEVKPFDVPTINTVPKLIYQFAEYADDTGYWNFVQGECHASEDAQINLGVQRDRFVEPPLRTPGEVTGLCMGVDVAKRVCHMVIGKDVGNDQVAVLMRKTLRIEDGPFTSQIEKIFIEYMCVQGLIDIGPDYTLSRSLNDRFGQKFRLASYVKDNSSDPKYYRDGLSTGEDNDPAVVKIQRTKGFNTLAKDMNLGKWTYAAGPDREEFLLHLSGMKRIGAKDKEGEVKHQWVKIPKIEDHYFHACMYLKAAIDLVRDGRAADGSVPAPPGVVGVSLGSALASGQEGSRIILPFGSGGSSGLAGSEKLTSLLRRHGIF